MLHLDLSFRIRSRPLCHSESALAVRNLLLFRNVELKIVTGKICETKELCVHVNIALELCIGYRAGGEVRSRWGRWDLGLDIADIPACASTQFWKCRRFANREGEQP